MQVNVSIGQNHHFALREALLIYRSTENPISSFCHRSCGYAC